MFKTEKDLTKNFIKNINNFDVFKIINPKNLFWMEETDLGNGIADIIIVNKTPRNINRGYILNSFDINVMKIIERTKNSNIDQLCNITKASKQKTKRSLEKLISDGFIKIKNDSYFIKKKYTYCYNINFAIEAKLRNWKRALFQAYRYQSFASYTYVLLDGKFINPAKENIDLFKYYNIGLIALYSNGNLDIINIAKRVKPYDDKLSKLLNEKLISHNLDFKNLSQKSK